MAVPTVQSRLLKTDLGEAFHGNFIYRVFAEEIFVHIFVLMSGLGWDVTSNTSEPTHYHTTDYGDLINISKLP